MIINNPINMELEEADKIRMEWGKFLEVANPQLLKEYGASIPISLLPHPKEKIEEAMDICIEYFMAEGRGDLVENLKACKVALSFYK